MATGGGIEPAALNAEGGGDPQLVEKPLEIHQRVWGLQARVDESVPFEEYVYWAKIEREEEREANRVYIEERGPLTVGKVLKNRFSKGIHHDNKKKAAAAQAAGVDAGVDKAVVVSSSSDSMSVSPEEWKTSARALRTASWGTVFYLITTDILGWSSTP